MTNKELAHALRVLHADKRQTGGIGPQTVRYKMYVIRASGIRLEALMEAADILDSLPQRGVDLTGGGS